MTTHDSKVSNILAPEPAINCQPYYNEAGTNFLEKLIKILLNILGY